MCTVAFSGASGTGKTSLAEKVSCRGWPFVDIGIRGWLKRHGHEDVDGLGVGERAQMQQEVLADKVTFERCTEKFVTDRSSLDYAAYALAAPELASAMDLCSYVDMAIGHAAECYDVIFLVPCGVIPWRGDGVRFGGMEIELIVRGLAQRAGIRLVEIGSVRLVDRVREVMRYLERR